MELIKKWCSSQFSELLTTHRARFRKQYRWLSSLVHKLISQNFRHKTHITDFSPVLFTFAFCLNEFQVLHYNSHHELNLRSIKGCWKATSTSFFWRVDLNLWHFSWNESLFLRNILFFRDFWAKSLRRAAIAGMKIFWNLAFAQLFDRYDSSREYSWVIITQSCRQIKMSMQSKQTCAMTEYRSKMKENDLDGEKVLYHHFPAAAVLLPLSDSLTLFIHELVSLLDHLFITLWWCHFSIANLWFSGLDTKPDISNNNNAAFLRLC